MFVTPNLSTDRMHREEGKTGVAQGRLRGGSSNLTFELTAVGILDKYDFY